MREKETRFCWKDRVPKAERLLQNFQTVSIWQNRTGQVDNIFVAYFGLSSMEVLFFLENNEKKVFCDHVWQLVRPTSDVERNTSNWNGQKVVS